jgi:DNA-binding NarL/FixJ family response regulator
VRILVVDDARVVRARFAAMLGEVDGVDCVLEAHDAGGALALLSSHALQVVVLDLHLRDGVSIDLVPQLKAFTPAPLVIVVTNDPSEPHRASCLAKGADHFFDKAREFDRVLDVVTLAVASAR